MTQPHPLIVIQSICTIWTKASRGGASALARNRTPDAVKLPSSVLQCSDDVFLLHEVIYTENNHFRQPLERQVQQRQTNPCRYNCLQFLSGENALSVTLEWERSEGVPRRSPFLRTAWFFQEDQWPTGCATRILAEQEKPMPPPGF